MGYKPRKARTEPMYEPTPWEIEAEKNNAVVADTLKRWLAEQEALMPSAPPTPKEIAEELLAVIDGRCMTTISSEALVLVLNLQGELMSDKGERQAHYRTRHAHFQELARELKLQQQGLIKLQAELWGDTSPERGVVRERIWACLSKAERIALEEAEKASESIAQGDVQRERAILAIYELGLSALKIADLILATDGVNWRTGELGRDPSDYLKDYLEPKASPRQWRKKNPNGDSGRELLKARLDNTRKTALKKARQPKKARKKARKAKKAMRPSR